MSMNFGFLQINWLVSRLGGLLNRLADTVGPELVPQSSYEPLQLRQNMCSITSPFQQRNIAKQFYRIWRHMVPKPYPPKRMVVCCDLQVFREPWKFRRSLRMGMPGIWKPKHRFWRRRWRLRAGLAPRHISTMPRCACTSSFKWLVSLGWQATTVFNHLQSQTEARPPKWSSFNSMDWFKGTFTGKPHI